MMKISAISVFQSLHTKFLYFWYWYDSKAEFLIEYTDTRSL